MLESPYLLGEFPTVGEYGIALGMLAMLVAEAEPPLLDGGVELKGKQHLFSLDDAVVSYGAKEAYRGRARQEKLVKPPVALGLPTVGGDAPAEVVTEGAEHRQVAVGDANGKDGVPGLGLGHADAPVGIEQASPIAVLWHQDLQVIDGMLVKSGEPPCPARKSAEGQSRTKQSGDTRSGVRNEHGPAPKGKMCSELGRNAERSAETTGPSADSLMCESISEKVTDCNTNYLHLS